MNEIISAIRGITNFIIYGFIVLLFLSFFIDSPFSSIGVALLFIGIGLIIAGIIFVIVIKIKTWFYFDWLNW